MPFTSQGLQIGTTGCPRCGIAADEAGWCAVCGADLVPEANYPRFSRAAQERERRWQDDRHAALDEFRARQGISTEDLAELQRGGTADAASAEGETGVALAEPDEKSCPDCAETVKSAAKVCRYCGYRFARPTLAPPPPAAYLPRSSPGTRARSSGTLSGVVVVGYVMAVFFPLVGFILGIVAATRNDESDRGHGPLVIAVAVISFVVWVALLNSA